MRCPDVQEWMSLKLDGCLPVGEERQLEAHLAACAACAEEWAEWQTIASLFEGAPMVQPPHDLTAQVLSRLEAGPRWSKLLSSLFVIWAGLVLIAVLLLVPWVYTCGTALQTAQTPGMLGVAASVLAGLIEFLATLADALRIILRAVVTPRSALAVVGYGATLLAVLTGWVRLVVVSPVRAEAPRN